jgi:cytosine/adenosine deaminase-related metal-dependent hydrolase
MTVIPETLAALSADRHRPVLFTGGAVVTMDPAIGDLDHGDVLLHGSRIAAIGEDLRNDPQHARMAADAVVIDTTGRIVSPGFVDTHRHAWETQLRRSIPDVTDLGAYVMSTLAGIAPVYTPHDMYVGTRLTALTALDAGITTMLDFSHNSRTAAHSDAALDALVDTGIRGVHAAMGPHFGTWDHQWPGDLQRLLGKYGGANDGLVTLRLAGLATAEIAGPALAYGRDLAAVARDLGVWVRPATPTKCVGYGDDRPTTSHRSSGTQRRVVPAGVKAKPACGGGLRPTLTPAVNRRVPPADRTGPERRHNTKTRLLTGTAHSGMT